MKTTLIALALLATSGCTVHGYAGVTTMPYGYSAAYSYIPQAQYVQQVPDYYFVASGCTNLNPNVCAARGY